MAPQDAAMETQVENDSTSTMITASLIGARCSTPCSPHSQRMS